MMIERCVVIALRGCQSVVGRVFFFWPGKGHQTSDGSVQSSGPAFSIPHGAYDDVLLHSIVSEYKSHSSGDRFANDATCQ